jgi:O-antigen/teichoic acid export membrane protein
VYSGQVFFARWSSVDAYGTYVWVWSTVTILAIPAALGLPEAAARFLPRYRAATNPAQVTRFVTVSRVAVGLSGLGWGLVCAALTVSVLQQIELIIALSAVALVPLLASSSLNVRLSHALAWPVRGYAPHVIVGQGTTLLMVTLVAIVKNGVSAADILACLAGGFSLAVLVQVWRVQPRAPLPSTPSQQSDGILTWLKVAAPLMLAGAAYAVLERADVVMLGALVDAESAGLYNAGARTAALVAFGVMAAGQVAAPRFSELLARGEVGELEVLLAKLNLYVLPTAWLAAALLVMARSPILALFGPRFLDAAPALVVLSVGHLVAATVWAGHHLLNVSGHERVTAVGLVAVVCVNIALNALLIPWLGVLGAAFATATSVSLWACFLGLCVRRLLGLNLLRLRGTAG